MADPRKEAQQKNQQKAGGEPAFDPDTGTPCPHDAVKGKEDGIVPGGGDTAIGGNKAKGAPDSAASG